MKRYYWIYTGWFVGLSIGLPIILGAVQYFTGVDLYTSVVSIMPAMFAALVAGMTFAKDRKTLPETSQSWQFARGSMVIAFVFSILFAVAAFAIFPEIKDELQSLLQPAILGVMAVVMAVLFVVIFLFNRVFFAMGAKNILKAEQRKKAKAG